MPSIPPTDRERILGGLWGSLVGDALGVPVEFRHRAAVQADPVTDMRGFGAHDQPAGTWSDDSSLLLCSTESLTCHTFDLADMANRFLRWKNEGHWTAHGHLFDIGTTTRAALNRIAAGVPARMAGGADSSSNGNGSLMRILPVSLRFVGDPLALNRVHSASAITHRHPRSQMACGLFTLVVHELLKGRTPAEAYRTSRAAFLLYYQSDTTWVHELLEAFQPLLSGELAHRHESEIESGGYVLDTLIASLWCLLTTHSFRECVLKAVNLGFDADTTGCVAGGLAGVCYGLREIPDTWLQTLPRREEVDALFNKFCDTTSIRI